MKNKKILFIISVVVATFIFSGCQNDDSIEKYNEVSKEHQQSATQAFQSLNEAITFYNNKEYDKAKQSAQLCKTLFAQTQQLSNDAKNIAENIKNEDWLIDYKDYSIQAEKLREDQCSYLAQVSDTTKDKDNEKSQELIDKISKLNDEYNKIQTTMEDIKSQHPEAFNNDGNNQ